MTTSRWVSAGAIFRLVPGKLEMLQAGKLTPARVIKYLNCGNEKLRSGTSLFLERHPETLLSWEIPDLERLLNLRVNLDLIINAFSKLVEKKYQAEEIGNDQLAKYASCKARGLREALWKIINGDPIGFFQGFSRTDTEKLLSQQEAAPNTIAAVLGAQIKKKENAVLVSAVGHYEPTYASDDNTGNWLYENGSEWVVDQEAQIGPGFDHSDLEFGRRVVANYPNARIAIIANISDRNPELAAALFPQ